MYRSNLLLAALLCTLSAGCSDRETTAETEPEAVYLCQETGALVVAPLEPVPAFNPQTGRHTLQRALYCAQCRKWHAVPPPDVRPGNPLSYRCPRHKTPMSPEGPLNPE